MAFTSLFSNIVWYKTEIYVKDLIVFMAETIEINKKFSKNNHKIEI